MFNTYDGFGRAVSTTTNMAGIFRTISRQFDRDGLRTELGFPDGEKFWARRDGLGRAVEHYQGPLGSTSTIMTAFAFDAASYMFRFSRRFGDASVYEYDPARRLAVLQDALGWGIGGTRSDSGCVRPQRDFGRLRSGAEMAAVAAVAEIARYPIMLRHIAGRAGAW